jgi:putative ABC transport system ATP-binding protein
MALITLTDIGRQYGTPAAPVRALDGVTLEIDAGEFVAVTGPSGSGKSTLLGILGAMDPPTTGRLGIDEIDVYRLGVEKLADFRREYLGFVFQQLYLVPHLTAIENVMLPLAAASLPNRQQHPMAVQALERVGLGDKLARLPSELSGGEQQRVAIARAMVNEPPILLADEPTGCLDSATGADVLDQLARLRQETGVTIVMVTHDHAIASRADRIVRLRDGRVVESARSSAPIRRVEEYASMRV